MRAVDAMRTRSRRTGAEKRRLAGTPRLWGRRQAPRPAPSGPEHPADPAARLVRAARLGHRVDGRPGVRGDDAARVPGAALALRDVPGSTLQRMIAVNTMGNPHQDYAIMKVVQQLNKNPDAGEIVDLTGATDFSQMDDGETLYIASHGVADSGELQGITTNQLLGWLNSGQRGVPAGFGGIVILSCYGGERIVNDQSLAERIAAGLRYGGKTVEGAQGFAFGSPVLAETGKTSVLSSALRPFYVLDIPDMIQTWSGMRPTHQEGVLGYVNQQATIAQQRQQGVIERLIRLFKSKASALEHNMQAILARVPGNSVAAKVEAIEDYRNIRLKQKWERQIDKQYELFHRYYLWTADGQAYQSVES